MHYFFQWLNPYVLLITILSAICGSIRDAKSYISGTSCYLACFWATLSQEQVWTGSCPCGSLRLYARNQFWNSIVQKSNWIFLSRKCYSPTMAGFVYTSCVHRVITVGVGLNIHYWKLCSTSIIQLVFIPFHQHTFSFSYLLHKPSIILICAPWILHWHCCTC